MPLEMSQAEADLRKEGSCWTSQSRRLDITAYGNVRAHATIRNSQSGCRNSASDFQAECQSRYGTVTCFSQVSMFSRNTRDSSAVARKLCRY